MPRIFAGDHVIGLTGVLDQTDDDLTRAFVREGLAPSKAIRQQILDAVATGDPVSWRAATGTSTSASDFESSVLAGLDTSKFSGLRLLASLGRSRVTGSF